MNNNISVCNNQAFFKEYINIAFMLKGSIPATFVPEHVSGYTPLRLKMINFVIRSLNINKVSFPSQSTIAKAVGCNRETVNVAFKFFEEQGLFIVKSGKKRWRTNIYSLGAVLCNKQVRWALRYVCTGLTRAYHRIADDLRSFVKKAIVEPKRTLLYKINVFKRINTNQGDYKENKLHTSPYIENKEQYFNMQKALWNDWSLNEDNYRREVEMLDQKLLFNPEAQEKIRKDRKYQQFKRNDAKFPTYYNDMAKSFDFKPFVNNKSKQVISHNTGKISSNVMNERLVLCNAETNLHRRLAMFERLKIQVERASVPYIDLMINKTKRKMEL